MIDFNSGWLGWGSSKNESGSLPSREKQVMELATPIYPKLGLADALREAISVTVSPNGNLAAVTDSLGRVVLIDICKGMAIRLWKGFKQNVVCIVVVFMCNIVCCSFLFAKVTEMRSADGCYHGKG